MTVSFSKSAASCSVAVAAVAAAAGDCLASTHPAADGDVASFVTAIISPPPLLSLSGIKGRNRVISESLPPPSAMTEQEELYIAAVQDVGTEGMAHLPVMLSQTRSLFAKNLP